MVILRVDDRLIHGQVIAGWVRPLGIKLIILVSNRICQDEWACNAYRLAIPEGIEFSCTNIEECMALVKKADKKNLMVIVESVKEARELVKNGLIVKDVNIGGISYKEGTREVATYIHLSAEDIEAVVYLHKLGIKVSGRQLPNSAAVDVAKSLAGVK